jgi:transposase InsO family protein
MFFTRGTSAGLQHARRGRIHMDARPGRQVCQRQCRSFIKTLKREEIYANQYDDLELLRANITAFVEGYYNRQRLHSALGYQTPGGVRAANRVSERGAGFPKCNHAVS